MVMNAEVQQRQEDVTTLTDFSDGRLFNEHPLFSNDERAIQLLLYYDDVISNKPHKMCLFYYQLVNLIPLYQRDEIYQLIVAEGEVNIGEYSLRRSRGEYSPIFTSQRRIIVLV